MMLHVCIYNIWLYIPINILIQLEVEDSTLSSQVVIFGYLPKLPKRTRPKCTQIGFDVPWGDSLSSHSSASWHDAWDCFNVGGFFLVELGSIACAVRILLLVLFDPFCGQVILMEDGIFVQLASIISRGNAPRGSVVRMFPGSITLVRLDYPKGLFLVVWCGVMVYLTTLVGVENDVFLNGNMLIN